MPFASLHFCATWQFPLLCASILFIVLRTIIQFIRIKKITSGCLGYQLRKYQSYILVGYVMKQWYALCVLLCSYQTGWDEIKCQNKRWDDVKCFTMRWNEMKRDDMGWDDTTKYFKHYLGLNNEISVSQPSCSDACQLRVQYKCSER